MCSHKPKPILPEDQRLQDGTVRSKVVDRAMLGEEKDIFQTIEQLKPDIITLGYDQHFDSGFGGGAIPGAVCIPGLCRIEAHEPCDLCSSSRIVTKILERFRRTANLRPSSTYMALSFAGLYGQSCCRRHLRSHS